MNPLAFLFHSSLLALNCYTIYFDYQLTMKYKFLPIPDVYVSKVVWLTMLGFFILTSYHVFGLIFSLLNLKKECGLRRKFDFMATTIVASTSATVVFFYHLMVLLDPASLINEKAKPFIEVQWFNHTLHTSPLIQIAIDFLIWRHLRPSKRDGFRAVAIFGLLYTLDIYTVHFISGFWAYPILGELPLIAQATFTITFILIFFSAFLATDLFNSFLQEKEKIH